jgi:GNAT superfamily N-acetyltransferase
MIDRYPIPKKAKNTFREFVVRFSDEIPDEYCFALAERSTPRLRFIRLRHGKLIGFVLYSLNFFDINGSDDQKPSQSPLVGKENDAYLELSYLFIDPVWRGHGLMTDALEGIVADVIDYVRDECVKSITCTADFVSAKGAETFDYFVEYLRSEVDVFGLDIGIDTDAGF